ncbi:hypothetical protein AKJ09_00917 [Labilithrix luteola]|uniref:Uncharacterized protein n=1 Tax=Labilithrix luteola TaxID=1391654 RepID=A0A0K1PL49_9BACT|nr:hypothetical protein [Labilithrix luteola]AKU94253.1 hypothetical protein AKJ09_00917 [Labilithrix luteola]
MTLTLARASLARLLRTHRAWWPVIGWTLFVVVRALAVRSGGTTNGTDQVMRGTFAFLVLPLVSYSLVGANFEGGLKKSVRGLVLLGARPKQAALGSTLVAIGAAGLVSAILAAVVCVLAHGATDPPLVVDLPASFGTGLLGGAAYAAYFSVGSAIGKGSMRGFLLAIDWIFGSGSGVLALITPRGHVTSLLGGPLCADLPARASSVILFVLLVVYVLLAVRLTRRV